LPGRIQYDNAASALATLQAVTQQLPVPEEAVRRGLMEARLPARFQRFTGPVECVLDVAHNPDAARVLADNLRAYPVAGRSFGVVGMFRDKAAEEVAQAIAPCLDRWFVGSLEGPRGQSSAALAARIHTVIPQAMTEEYPSIADAHTAALAAAQFGDRVVVFGSFQTVSAILTLYSRRAA
jgi:dihydrofolate synthase/folylpolyglutamate synthase